MRSLIFVSSVIAAPANLSARLASRFRLKEATLLSDWASKTATPCGCRVCSASTFLQMGMSRDTASDAFRQISALFRMFLYSRGSLPKNSCSFTSTSSRSMDRRITPSALSPTWISTDASSPPFIFASTLAAASGRAWQRTMAASLKCISGSASAAAYGSILPSAIPAASGPVSFSRCASCSGLICQGGGSWMVEPGRRRRRRWRRPCTIISCPGRTLALSSACSSYSQSPLGAYTFAPDGSVTCAAPPSTVCGSLTCAPSGRMRMKLSLAVSMPSCTRCAACKLWMDRRRRFSKPPDPLFRPSRFFGTVMVDLGGSTITCASMFLLMSTREPPGMRTKQLPPLGTIRLVPEGTVTAVRWR
mmetsp:Transcript_26773/g.58317  ORF Transcript_26773/g.58317 Transcript_26773/m.58317 type:complete len:361 (+) Transcript_26773:807-1889(+)